MTTTPTPIQKMQGLATSISEGRAKLGAIITLLENHHKELVMEYEPEINMLVQQINQNTGELQNEIKLNAGLFKSPKTLTVDNVRFGMTKQRGKLQWADDDALIAKIRELAAKGEIARDVVEQLINTTEKPAATGLNNLPATTLKKLGVTVLNSMDVPSISYTDSEVKKMVDDALKAAQASEKPKKKGKK